MLLFFYFCTRDFFLIQYFGKALPPLPPQRKHPWSKESMFHEKSNILNKKAEKITLLSKTTSGLDLEWKFLTQCAMTLTVKTRKAGKFPQWQGKS